MKYLKYLIIIVLINLSLFMKADDLFETANDFYAEKNYTEALTNYLKIKQSGLASANLYYNIGNCYFKLDSLNMALLYFERAKKLDPNDADIQHNIDFLNETYTDKIEEVPQIIFSKWNHSLIKLFSKSVWAYISLAFYLLLVSAIVYFFVSNSEKHKRISLLISAILLLFSIFTTVYAYQEYSFQTKEKSGIIFTPTLNVKSSPDDSSSNLFVIHQGTKVYILDQIGEWYQIRIKDGNQGWIKTKNLKII